MSTLSSAIESLLPLVLQPARYLGTEIGVLRHAWSAERVRWLLILPDVYEIGMSHQGLRILYDILNRRPDALAERAFAPWVDMEARMRAAGLPLFSLESRRPAAEFDVVGFSLQYELLATNLLNLLDLAGIPLLAAERREHDPLIAAGGPCTGNPEPLANFIDFFLIGDGEEAVGAITSALQATRGLPRRERLLTLARLPGIYVPRFYEALHAADGRQIGARPVADVPMPVRRTWLPDLDRAPYPARPIVPLIEAVQDRLTIEIQRGCTQGCRFCQAGIFYRPVRERPPEQLVDLIAAGLPASGWSEVSLSSLSTADYGQIEPLTRLLADTLTERRIGLSFSSLRVDTFSVELAELVARVRKTGFTFAPEAGTARLRAVINKRISDADLLQAVEAAYARGWRGVKLYFMIGLPTETQADLEGLAELVGRVRAMARSHGAGRQVTVSVGGFVPKAHTPFQWEAFDEGLAEKVAWLKEHVHSRWSPLRWHDPAVSAVEAALSRADRRAGAVIAAAWRRGGRFDGWSDHFDAARWAAAWNECGLDPRAFAGALDPDAGLPWDTIDLGVSRDYLRAERERALRGEATADCRDGQCNACGLPCSPGLTLAEAPTFAVWDALRARLTGALAASEPAREAAPAALGDAEAVPGEAAPAALGDAEAVPGDAAPAALGDAEAVPGEAAPAVPGDAEAVPGDAAAAPGHAVAATAASGPPTEPLGYRIVFSKTDRLRFISHLELGRLLIRILRMARWPLAFTSGHHPHPKLAYGPPLPLGVEGEQELFDAWLRAPLDADLLAAAGERAPAGLAFLRAEPLPVGSRSLTTLATAAEYIARIPEDLAGLAEREGRLEAFAGAEAFLWLKSGKGRQRTVDLKRCVLDVSWSGPGTLRLLLRLQEEHGHVAGPLHVLRELFKWSAEDLARACVLRRRLLDERGGELG